jgi:hypothetical protein
MIIDGTEFANTVKSFILFAKKVEEFHSRHQQLLLPSLHAVVEELPDSDLY